MATDLKTLVSLLAQCESDTREIIGTGAANMLAYWQRYEGDLDRLVKFAHDRIYGDSKVNGWTLEQNKRLSLERIVFEHCPELFSPSEVRQARINLGLE
jgi:hypothetical protein